MLMISQTEAGVGELTKADVDIGQIVENACDLFHPMAAEKGVELVCDEIKPSTLKGDKPLLQRMVANLIDNAIKYTPPGGSVEVSVHVKNHHEIALTVADTGVGISNTDLPHIFERFYRCDPSRSTTGSGLGLSLAKTIAQAHQGRIHVESQSGRGSTFRVLLPHA